MRHGVKGNHLSRTKSHRKALLKNLTCALIKHKRITTTLAKAKALRTFIEPLVTKAVKGKKVVEQSAATHHRRVVFSYLQNKEAVTELFGNIAAQVGDRPGGYIRVIRTGFRKGDGAATAMIEFVDYNDIYTAKGSFDANKKKTRRSRRKSSGASTVTGAAVATATAAVASTKSQVDDLVEDVNDAIADETKD